MAYRPGGYGLSAEVKSKIHNKYNRKSEKECLDWIAEVRYC